MLQTEIIGQSPEARAAQVAAVFFGGEDREEFTPVPSQELWDGSIRAVERFLVRFAHSLLADAHLYNAAKHGLAVQPAEYGMRVDFPNMPAFRDGMAIQYLEVKDDSWYRTVQWVESEISATLVHSAADLMEQMWGVARGRYLGERGPGLRMFDEGVHDVLRDATKKLRGESALPIMIASQKAVYLPPFEDTLESE
jgi:hypothetical protein